MKFFYYLSATFFSLFSGWLVFYGGAIALSTMGSVMGSDFGMMVQGVNLQAQIAVWFGLYGIMKANTPLPTSKS